MINITYAGVDYRHPKTFVINRPFGAGAYDLVLFKTKTEIWYVTHEIPYP